MRLALPLLLALPLAAIGCSQGTRSETSSSNSAAPPTPSATAVPQNEAGMRRLAECAQRLEAVGDLYDAIASAGSDSGSAEMQQLARQRREGSVRFDSRAGEIAKAIGRRTDDVDMIRVEETERLELEQERQGFENFALWLGKEADACAPLDIPTR